MRSLFVTVACCTLLALSFAHADELPRRGLLGIAVGPSDDGRGIVVSQVSPNTSASRAGLVVGDLVTSLDGKPVTGPREFAAAVGGRKAGESIVFSFERAGQARELDVVLVPFPEERYENASTDYGHVTLADGSRLRTISTIPSGNGPFPAVFVLQGIDCGSVDRPLLVSERDSFMAAVREMAESGFVTLRVDKSGVSDSEGPACSEIDFETEIAGYRAALAALFARSDVDRRRVHMLGFSMGGVMAPLLAAERARSDTASNVHGIAVYGTITKSFLEYIVENRRRQLPREQLAPLAAERSLRGYQEFWARALLDELSPGQVLQKWPHIRGSIDNIDETHFFNRHITFFHQLHQQDLPAAWSAFSGRVLAVHGEYDWVSARDDHERIGSWIRNPDAFRFVPLRGYDHLGTVHATLLKSYADYGRGEVDRAFVDTLLAWLRGENV